MKIKDRLQSLVILTEEELKNYLYSELQRYYSLDSIYLLDGGIVVKGKDKATLVSHMDIHPIINIDHKEKKLLSFLNTVYCKTGIGGDDRCGVLVILELLDRGYRPNIIFTEKEEVGRVGVRKLIDNHLDLLIEITKDSPYLMGLDRKGFNEVVFYGCGNKEFINFLINEYHLDYNVGSFSDVSNLGPSLNKAICNISVCYYSAHSENEYVNLKKLKSMIDKIEGMVKDCNSIKNYSY
ncbi:MAG: hypothetical protein E7177_03610 [Erysipelotrichaceae bacterium]|nr:hypothetical protein [Erysipelotrichaceae bacterium]